MAITQQAEEGYTFLNAYRMSLMTLFFIAHFVIALESTFFLPNYRILVSLYALFKENIIFLNDQI